LYAGASRAPSRHSALETDALPELVLLVPVYDCELIDSQDGCPTFQNGQPHVELVVAFQDFAQRKHSFAHMVRMLVLLVPSLV
jgi:hypothetical protein